MISPRQAQALQSGRGKVKPAWSDEALCRLIFDLRRSTGACGIGQLVKLTGQTKQGLTKRLATLERRDLIEWQRGVHGSIRTKDETIFRKDHKPT